MSSKNVDGITRRFRKWRARMGLTLEQVSEAVNRYLPEERQVARSTVNNYEARNPPPATFLAALKKAFPNEVNLGWLLFGDDAPEEEELEGDLLFRVVGRESSEASRNFGVAAGVVDEMFADLLLSYPRYRAGDDTVQSLDSPSEELGELYDIFRRAFEIPFGAPHHFAELEELTAGEIRNYAYAMIAALRPLLRVVREDPRPARPISMAE